MASILLLDNYDSFTHNLLHYVEDYGKHQIEVIRNDKIKPEEVEPYDGLILSPGPGLPAEAGNMPAIISHYYSRKRIFGVCLGLQAIAEFFGGSLLNLEQVYHGIATPMQVEAPEHYLFNGITTRFEAGRYHSWIVNRDTLPSCLRTIATDHEGSIMGLSHTRYDICGVQFHPESILTPSGKKMVFNWLEKFE